MKTLILLSALLMSNAYAIGYKAVSANYTIFSNVGGAQVYYNCDSVENDVERMLEEMGAKNIRVRCSGGLDTFGRFSTSAFVRAHFEVLSYEVSNDGTIFSSERVEIKERDNCHLYNTSFRALSKFFEMTQASTGSCFRPGDRTRISFNVIKE